MKQHFQQFAGYNQWANRRLYEAALALPEGDYRRDTGVFFGSLHGTLNHLLVADRIWLKRITGSGEAPDKLDAILFLDRAALRAAREAEDARLAAVIDLFPPEAFDENFSYRNTAGAMFTQPLRDILAHVFNHQTHHRGHAHACLSILTGKEPPSLDLVAYQRTLPGFKTS